MYDTLRVIELGTKIPASAKVQFNSSTGEKVECYLTHLQSLKRDFPDNRIQRIKYFRGVSVNGMLMSLKCAKDIIEWYDTMVDQGRITFE